MTSAPAQPALPILASSLFDALPQPSRKRKRVGTGIAAIDDALNEGVAAGKGGLFCISAELSGGGGRELAQSFLISSLLSMPSFIAAIIDTTGSFDILRLHTAIASRLRSNDAPRTNAPNTGVTAPPTDIDYEAEAARALERVRIMRVFDFVGLVEAVGEIRAELEKPASMEEELEVEPEVGGDDWPASPPRRSTVPDSQASSSPSSSEDMLFQASPKKASEPIVRKQPESALIADPERSDDATERPKTALILIDSLTSVLTPLLKNKYTQAHALLVPFLRSLTNLINTHELVTILLDTATKPTPGVGGTSGAGPNSTPSIFSSCTLRPSLGTTFPYYLDLHLLVHRVPRDGKRKKGIVHVVEVLSDRWEGRVGRWAGFNISREGMMFGVDGSGNAPGRLTMGIEVPEFSTWWRHK